MIKYLLDFEKSLDTGTSLFHYIDNSFEELMGPQSAEVVTGQHNL